MFKPLSSIKMTKLRQTSPLETSKEHMHMYAEHIQQIVTCKLW